MLWQYKNLLLKTIIHLSALGLIVYQYYLAVIDQLGGDPVEAVIHFTGIGALNLLCLTLCITPVAKYAKQSWLMKSRRLLGVYSFVYALCHIINFWAFEVQFDVSLFITELFERPYITLGLVAFIILFLLSITSINKVQRKMGRKWQTLHNFVYLAVLLIAIHFYWSVKSEIIEPSIYFIITAVLLSLRNKKFKRWLKKQSFF